MSNFSNPCIVPENRPLDPDILQILSVVHRTAAEQKCLYLVIGATARDLLLYHVFGIPAMRATRDVDFAIAVEDWNVFTAVRAALLATDNFAPGNVEHRLFFRGPNGKTEIPIDLIPFGGVAEDNTIKWPPEKSTILTVAGFEDALAACVHVQVTPRMLLPVASLAGLAILKIFAWHDRPSTDKDALDLYRVITTYADAGNTDRLYDSETALLEALHFDLDLAGAALLGRDARRIASRSTLETLRFLLKSANFLDRLVERIRTSRWPLQPEQAPHVSSLLSTFSDYLLRE